MKKIDKLLTHFGDALCKSRFYFYFLSYVVFNLTIECTPGDLTRLINSLDYQFGSHVH